MKKLLPYMKKYIKYAVLCPILMILEVTADIAIPYLMSRIVDVGIANQDIQYVLKIGIIMVAAALAGMTFGIISSHYGAKAGFGFASEIRLKLFEKIQGFSFANLDKFTVASLITRLTNDCNTLGQVTMMSLRMAVRAPFMMVFALLMALNINASLAKVFVVSIPVLVTVLVIILSKARPLFLKMQTKIDRVNANIRENLTAIRVVKSFNRQSYEEERFKERNDSLMDTALKAITLIVFLMPVLSIVVYSTIVAVLWFGGKQVAAGTMETGQLISFITPFQSSKEFASSVKSIAMGFLNRLAEDLEEFSDVNPGEGKIIDYYGKKVGVYKNEAGEYYCINPVCSHLKCALSFNEAEKTWDCPCHGSRFDIKGNILEGPAVRPIDKIKI